jgi:hypothetical protein
MHSQICLKRRSIDHNNSCIHYNSSQVSLIYGVLTMFIKNDSLGERSELIIVNQVLIN